MCCLDVDVGSRINHPAHVPRDRLLMALFVPGPTSVAITKGGGEKPRATV